MNALEVKELSKNYGTYQALDNVSFSIKKGEVFGLLGPNGAGKTTLINILIGILTANKGEVTYFGETLNESVKNKINVSSAYRSVSAMITVEQNLRVYADIYNVKNPEERITELLKRFLINDIRKKKVREISSGQKTRVNLCKALINSPEILFLDEATAGLDPQIAKTVREEIKKLDCTILFTSHIMSEVEELCDRIAFLRKGKIIGIETAEHYKKLLHKTHTNPTLEDVFISIAEEKL